jgi:hypothetical protein
MLPQQLYRWSKLLTNWLGTFTQSTWVNATSVAGLTSAHPFTPRVSVNTSVGASAMYNVRILVPSGATLQRQFWFRSWFASAKDSPPIAAGVSLIFSTGQQLHQSISPRMYYVYTGTGFSTTFRVNGTPVSTYMAVQAEDCPPVRSIKVGPTAGTDDRWYPFVSVHAESGNSRKFYLEPRKSSDGSRFQRNVLLHFRFDQTQAGTVNPSLASVNWSNGAKNLITQTNLRVYMVRLASTGDNWLRLSKAAAGPVCCRVAKADAALSYILFSTSFA